MDQIKSDVHERINQRLSVEKKVLQERKTEDIIQLIEYGKVDRAIGHLFYFGTSNQFEELTKEITNKIDQIVKGKKQENNCFSKYYFGFLVKTCIGLSSALVEWRITSEFSSLIIDELRKSYKNLLALVPKNNQNSQDLLTHYADEVKKRYCTEEHDIQERLDAFQY